jgi:hypothetical protein
MKCLHPKCRTDSRSRGLCATHFAIARMMIRTGDANETNLLRRGLILKAAPGARRSGRPRNPENDIFLKTSKVAGRGAKV